MSQGHGQVGVGFQGGPLGLVGVPSVIQLVPPGGEQLESSLEQEGLFALGSVRVGFGILGLSFQVEGLRKNGLVQRELEQ